MINSQHVSNERPVDKAPLIEYHDKKTLSTISPMIFYERSNCQNFIKKLSLAPPFYFFLLYNKDENSILLEVGQ
ncbi:predicted protein [Enterococcus gallinarum EG2]|nr:predicted protein [Enterococcus gallinarum EG2]